MDSFTNYLWDLFVKSFECKESLLESALKLNDSEKRSLIASYLGDVNTWEHIYEDRKKNLEDNVYLVSNNILIHVESILFHPKFGWTVYGGGVKAYLGKSSVFRQVRIEIGHRTYFSGHSSILGDGVFKIGSYSAVGENLYANVQTDHHPFNYPALINFRTETRLHSDGKSMNLTYDGEFENAPRGITIGSDVWIGRNVRVFNGVRIGNGCVIAEGSLVKNDCEPYGIYAGIPARFKRHRFQSRIVDELLEASWWDWSEEKIFKNRKFFDTNLTDFDGHIRDLIEE
jgi:acetyltransferase-like isoleucine patch superfamily enzyme